MPRKGYKHTPEAKAKMRGNKNCLGRKLTAEHKAKISAALKGRTLTPEHRAKMSAVNKGKKLSHEHRTKLSAARMGHKVTAATRAKIGVASKGHRRLVGYKHTAKTRANMSESRKARVFTVEHRAKLSAAKMGLRATPEAIANMSAAQRGHKVTVETRAKISGPNNPAWRGGLSNEPYPLAFNERFKELIRARDGYTCQLCPTTQEQNGRALSVHHIDYDKNNLDPENHISLCQSCHARTQTNRFFWSVELRLRIVA